MLSIIVSAREVGGGVKLKLRHSTRILCALMSYIEWISIEFHEAKPE